MADISSSVANASSGKNQTPGVTECEKDPPISAVILYPSLGTPLILAPGQTKCSIFLGAAAEARTHFTIDEKTKQAHTIHCATDRHLRLYDIKKKGTKTDTTQGTLFGDGKTFSKAKTAINGWLVGDFAAGALIKNRHGQPFATISTQAAEVYRGLSHVYEIEIDLTQGPFTSIGTDAFKTFAWMVEIDEEHARHQEYQGVTHVEGQDMYIHDFLHNQKNAAANHFARPYEFNLDNFQATGLPAQRTDRLMSWHPVIRGKSDTLKIGHLSDVHVNVRHNALAQSPARVIEDDAAGALADKVGGKVCNSFMALKDLFEQFGKGENRADAIFLTGDLIDFNRNIDPDKVGGTIGDQWRNFNVLGKLDDKNLYKRGMDDMLMYSLVRHSYRELTLPVFMTTGNHEAYDVPYGVSPRADSSLSTWANKMGRMEEMATGMSPVMPTIKRDGWWFKTSSREEQIADLRKDVEAASEWIAGKANEGIAADHNMTIYEATLAYGPTYAQIYTARNFHADNFDWFSALFTPLSDFVIPYGAKPEDPAGKDAKQVLCGLEWGNGEVYINLSMEKVKGMAGDRIWRQSSSPDAQGSTVLPRATHSINEQQKHILNSAGLYKQNSKAKLLVATHFTIINYNKSPLNAKLSITPFDRVQSEGQVRVVDTPAFNDANFGTCEKNLKWYFDTCVFVDDTRRVNHHLSGHSHRSGLYRPTPEDRPNMLRRANIADSRDPGLHGEQKSSDQHTNFIVSSCGGPIGVQNLYGELNGWTLRPPSGTLLDAKGGAIKQVKTSDPKKNTQPRLCVALDYLAVMSRGDSDIAMPLNFMCTDFKPGQALFSRTVDVTLSDQMTGLACITGMNIWVFVGGRDEETGDAKKTWHRLTPSFSDAPKQLFGSSSGSKKRLTFSASDLNVLDSAFRANGGTKIPQAFCEVLLKKPTVAAGQPDWGKDMNFSDSWVFPLEIQFRITEIGAVPLIGRPAGERGEVPDWGWLFKTYRNGPGNSYPDPQKVIKG